MKRPNKLIVLIMSALLVFTAFAVSACQGEKDNRTVIKVWSMSDEANTLLDYYKLYNPAFEKDYKFDFVSTNNDDGSYEANLTNALPTGGPDFFVTDVDYTKKYVNTDYTEDLTPYYRKSLGLKSSDGYSQVTEKLAEDMYQYTLDIGSQGSGNTAKLKAVSYQVTPGAMFYRADLFLELVKKGITIDGTTYADFAALKQGLALSADTNIENYLTWSQADKEKLDTIMQTFVAGGDDPLETFKDAVAAVASNAYNTGKDDNKKVLLLSNIEDIKRVFYASRSSFVQGDKVVIDEHMSSFLDYAKALYPNTHKSAQWDEAWQSSMKAANTPDTTGKTLAFFMPTWGLFYTLNTGAPADNPSYGYWRMIEGPQAYYWGGSYIFMNNKSQHKDLVFEIINFLTSKEFMLARSAYSGDVMNSKDINQAFGNMNFSNEYLGGQNHFAKFNIMAAKVTADNVTPDDGSIDRIFTDIVKRYVPQDSTFANLEAAKTALNNELKSNFSGKTIEIK